MRYEIAIKNQKENQILYLLYYNNMYNKYKYEANNHDRWKCQISRQKQGEANFTMHNIQMATTRDKTTNYLKLKN